MKTIIVIITLSFLIVFALVFFIFSAFRTTYLRTKDKISDLDLLIFFVEEANVLSVKQLSKMTPLSSVEVMIRMQAWVNNGVLRTLYSDAGETLYQLKYKMPANRQLFNIKNYKDNKILEIVLNHISGVEVSPAHLVKLFGISVRDARNILKRMVAEGLLKTQFGSNFQRTYISMLNPFELDKIKIPKLVNVEFEKTDIKDADVLKLAIQKDGKLTVAQLCVEKEISLDEAQDLLDNLYEKGAFYIDADENDSTLEYVLRDNKLLKK